MDDEARNRAEAQIGRFHSGREDVAGRHDVEVAPAVAAAKVGAVGDEQLTELEEKARGATPGPWHVVEKNYGVVVRSASGAQMVDYTVSSSDQDRPDAAYIAAANPAIVLALIAEVRRLRTEIAASHDLYRKLLDRLEGSLGIRGAIGTFSAMTTAEKDALIDSITNGIVADRDADDRRGSAFEQVEQAERVGRLLDEMDREAGPVPPEVQDEVRRLPRPE